MVEHQIRKAQAEGQFDNLSGAGKPLPPAPPGDAAEAAGFRIMAEAGTVPREVQLRKDVAAQRLVVQAATTPEAQKVAMAKLADLELRVAIEQEARRKFYATR
ncbi:MAG: DUF1992 domain-containing protein [Limimaricola sp.]|nr:DUF1992 domain-containing protein [Limimaricola sp.]